MTSNKDVEEFIRKKANELDINIFSVISTSSFGYPLVSITFYSKLDMDDLLNRLEYKYKCDKSGFTIIDSTLTVMFTGSAIVSLLNKL